MPDASGQLSPVEIKAVLDWMVAQHGKPYACPLSGHVAWAVNPFVYQMMVFPIQGLSSADTVSRQPWPVVQVACGGCGYTMEINAGLIGLFPQQLSTEGR